MTADARTIKTLCEVLIDLLDDRIENAPNYADVRRWAGVRETTMRVLDSAEYRIAVDNEPRFDVRLASLTPSDSNQEVGE